jgi:hypothetical protein
MAPPPEGPSVTHVSGMNCYPVSGRTPCPGQAASCGGGFPAAFLPPQSFGGASRPLPHRDHWATTRRRKLVSRPPVPGQSCQLRAWVPCLCAVDRNDCHHGDPMRTCVTTGSTDNSNRRCVSRWTSDQCCSRRRPPIAHQLRIGIGSRARGQFTGKLRQRQSLPSILRAASICPWRLG